MKKRIEWYVWFVFLVSTGIFAFNSILLAQSRKKLIAVTEEWPPFRIQSQGSKHGFVGIDIDILERLAVVLNREIEVQRHPFARALEMIRTGDADIIPGVAHTEKRAAFILYVPTSYFEVGPVFYTQKGRGHLVRDYEDLYRFDVGYSLHSAYFEPFNSDGRIRKIGVSTEEQLVKMVALNRLDITIGTNPNLAWDIKRYGFKDKLEQTHYIPTQKTPIYFGLAKGAGYGELQLKIDSYLKKIIANGELQQIIDAYL